MKLYKKSFFKIVYIFTTFIFLLSFLIYFYSDILVKNFLLFYTNSSKTYEIEMGKLEKGSFDQYFIDSLKITSKNNFIINVDNLLIDFNLYNFILNRKIIESLFVDDLSITYKKNINSPANIEYPNINIENIEINNIHLLTDSFSHSFKLKSKLNIIDNEINVNIDSLLTNTLLNDKVIITNTDFLLKNDYLVFNVGNIIHNSDVLSVNGNIHKSENKYDFYLNYLNFYDLNNNLMNISLNKIDGFVKTNNHKTVIEGNYNLNIKDFDALAETTLNVEDNLVKFNTSFYNDYFEIKTDGDYNINTNIWKISSNINKVNYEILENFVTLKGEINFFGDSNKIITSDIKLETQSINNYLSYNSVKAKLNYKNGFFNSIGPISLSNASSNISITDLYYDFDSLNFNTNINFDNYKLNINENLKVNTNGLTTFNISKVNNGYKFSGNSSLEDIENKSIKINEMNSTFSGSYQNNDLNLDGFCSLFSFSNNYQDIDSLKFKFSKNESKYMINSLSLNSNINDSLFINNIEYIEDNYFHLNDLIGNYLGPNIDIPSAILSYENNFYNFNHTPIYINNRILKINGKINRFKKYDLSLILKDINLIDLNEILNNGQRTAGLINGNFRIVNTNKNQFFLSNFNMRNGYFDDIVFDHLNGEISYRNKKLLVSELMYESSNSNLFLEGWLSCKNLFSDNKLLEAKDSLEFNISSDSFNLEKLNNYIPINNNLGGFLNSNAKIKGTLEDLDIFMNTEVLDFKFDNLNADKIKGNFIYNNSQLYLKGFNFINQNEMYTVSGSFPINLNFTNIDKNLSELPLDILITGKSNNFNILTSNIDNIEYLDGDISVQLSIGGNYNQPVRNGQLIIRNGILSLLDLNNTINDINGIGILSNNKLVIEQLSANTDISNNNKESFFNNVKNNLINIFNRKDDIESSILNLYGSIDLKSFFKPDYSIILKGKNILIEDTKGNFTGRGNADFTITGKDTIIINGQFEPDPNNFKIISEFNSKDINIIKPKNKTIFKYNLDLPLQNGIKVENSLMDLYMDGYLNLSSFNNEPFKYSGELNIIEGSFFYNGNEFTNIEGNIYLEPTNFNPELNIYGSTNIAGEDIDVSFIGPLDNPNLSLESYNNFSQSDIIELLLFRDNKETKLTPNDQIENFISNYFENELERNISKYTFLNKFQFNSTGSLLSGIEDKDLDLYVGANISTKLFMNYKRDVFSNQNDAEYEIGYRMNRNMSIVAKIDENKLLNLNYRIRYHYK